MANAGDHYVVISPYRPARFMTVEEVGPNGVELYGRRATRARASRSALTAVDSWWVMGTPDRPARARLASVMGGGGMTRRAEAHGPAHRLACLAPLPLKGFGAADGGPDRQLGVQAGTAHSAPRRPRVLPQREHGTLGRGHSGLWALLPDRAWLQCRRHDPELDGSRERLPGRQWRRWEEVDCVRRRIPPRRGLGTLGRGRSGLWTLLPDGAWLRCRRHDLEHDVGRERLHGRLWRRWEELGCVRRSHGPRGGDDLTRLGSARLDSTRLGSTRHDLTGLDTSRSREVGCNSSTNLVLTWY